ncbi:MAG: hypothetical protein KKG09_02100 [Verrucomicrobia bacterium]|nr:hypothetical protein [Verrucomicrobiota bacterium]MCG2681421.1 hypothetical protein [Kiritimatiellia bacterium]MBU4248321.1 hypothetical protein [Verrucomicrobiota bacterium]MBU4289848.1 hypothetical protein [Verrucomicrobiota bacterium]MBU4430319.1 hypothetical protein [Verrucomicrobiota bacterium]
MSVRLANPYRDIPGHWIRANFHGHTKANSPCANVPLNQAAQMYHDIGARIMAVTDHDVVTDLETMKKTYPDMIFLQGFEYSRRENLLFIGETVPPLYEFTLEEALERAKGLLTIVCHPQPRKNEIYWTYEKILALGRLPDGIEIFNGHYGTPFMRAKGFIPQYTALWDEFLTKGHRIWGFANDDFHEMEDFNNAYNMVLVDNISIQSVLQSARNGCFYATTGLKLNRIMEHDGHIAVTLETSGLGRFIGPGGKILKESEGCQFEYQATDEAYLRFEANGSTGRLFLQPMFSCGVGGTR